jgi:acylglycerol lipase
MQENMDMMAELSTPFLVLHGGKDQLCNVSGSNLLYASSPSEDKEILVYKTAKHQLYLEVPDIRQDSVDKTVDWVVSRARKPLPG